MAWGRGDKISVNMAILRAVCSRFHRIKRRAKLNQAVASLCQNREILLFSTERSENESQNHLELVFHLR